MTLNDTPEPRPLLAARDLVFAREDEVIFGPLAFTLEPGAALVVEGDNGTGKTTLIRVLAGLLEPTAGELEWRGMPYDASGREPGSVALLGHHLGLKSDLSPYENLCFRIGLTGFKPGSTPASALRSVGLEGYEDVPVRALSAGQRKRSALAALLLSGASLWLLDEPFANLDREGRILVDRMLETHCLRGGGAVLTSHGLIHSTLTNCATLVLGNARR